MSKEIESISSALFDKIRSRFPNVTLGDESAKACTDPAFTIRTSMKFQRLNGLAGARPGHFHKPQLGNTVDLRLGMVFD